MSRIDEIHGTSQDVLYAFDFTTRKRPAFINVKNKLVQADLSGKDFDPLLCFPFYENISNPDRKIEDLVLACQWIGPEKITMEILPGLIESMPHVDPETINFIVKGKEKKQGEAIYWPDIAFILVYTEIKKNFEPLIIDDILKLQPVEGADTDTPQEQEGEPGSKTIDEQEARAEKMKEAFYQAYQQKPVKKQPSPYELPKKQELPKKKQKAKLLPFTQPRKPPQEVWEWCKSHYPWGGWKRILRALHKYSLYRKRNEDKYYHGKSQQKNRQYIRGQVWLAKKVGIPRSKIEKWLHRFEADGIIYVCQRGYIDRGASIIELAFTESHRRMNKRKTGER